MFKGLDGNFGFGYVAILRVGSCHITKFCVFATMVGVIEENGVDVLCFVGFDHGFCKSCIGRLAGFCIS